MTESRFRERRSAHRDETATEPELTVPVEPSEFAASESAPAPEGPPEAPPEAPDVEVSRPDTEPEPAAAPAGLDQLAEMEVPEPSFLELIEPHIEMALRFLGELPITPEGERRVLPGWAKREIDLLGLVEQRTQGNLPPEEQAYLTQALDHLRTMYLKVSR